jgi:hypothetical protein
MALQIPAALAAQVRNREMLAKVMADQASEDRGRRRIVRLLAAFIPLAILAYKLQSLPGWDRVSSALEKLPKEATLSKLKKQGAEAGNTLMGAQSKPPPASAATKSDHSAEDMPEELLAELEQRNRAMKQVAAKLPAAGGSQLQGLSRDPDFQEGLRALQERSGKGSGGEPEEKTAGGPEQSRRLAGTETPAAPTAQVEGTSGAKGPLGEKMGEKISGRSPASVATVPDPGVAALAYRKAEPAEASELPFKMLASGPSTVPSVTYQPVAEVPIGCR